MGKSYTVETYPLRNLSFGATICHRAWAFYSRPYHWLVRKVTCLKKYESLPVNNGVARRALEPGNKAA